MLEVRESLKSLQVSSFLPLSYQREEKVIVAFPERFRKEEKKEMSLVRWVGYG